MGVGDGTVLGTTKIVDNGSSTSRWNLAIVSEGYQAAEMPTFATDATNLVNDLFALAPFNSVVLGHVLNRAINVHRVDVTSTDSGADDPLACGGSGATPATYFDASFCNSQIRRLLLVDSALVISTVGSLVPAWHAILVIVNSPIYGGAGGAVGTFSKAASANLIGIHELGHSAFGLADEYEYWAGCGVDTDRDNHPAGALAQPNVTTNLTPLKWNAMVTSGAAIPTTTNADCAQCDPQSSPVPSGTVGAFEGAHYYHCDAWRPEYNCMMRQLGQPFCTVCRERIISTLSPFLPPLIGPGFPSDKWKELFELQDIFQSVLDRINPVVDPAPFDLVRLRNLLNRGSAARADVLSSLLADEASVNGLESGVLRTGIVQMKSQIARLQSAVAAMESELQKRQP